MNGARTFALVAIAIIAFAGNSLLTRLALAAGGDPALFAGVRLLTGALALALLGWFSKLAVTPRRADLPGIGCLCLYTAAFTFAYVSMGAATGALVLFSSVQAALVVLGIARGRYPRVIDLFGIAVAMGGLAILLGPQATSASPVAMGLMIVAGIAWGGYTALGQGVPDATARTARAFIGSAPLAMIFVMFAHGPAEGSSLALATASGVLTSAGGYALWYVALSRISLTTAGTAQLLVPAVASAGALLFLGEPVSGQFLVAASLILVGNALTIRLPTGKSRIS